MNAHQRRVARRAVYPQVQAAVDLWKARREATLARVLVGPIDNASFAQSLRPLVQTDVSVLTAPVLWPAPRPAAAMGPGLCVRSYRDDQTGLRVARPGLWSVNPDGSFERVDEVTLAAFMAPPASTP